MKHKQVLGVYIAAFIAFIILSVLCLPDVITPFRGLCALILISMMLAMEYIMYGKSTRVIIDSILYAGIVIAVILGINNPNLDYLITNVTILCFTFLVLVTTYRTLKQK